MNTLLTPQTYAQLNAVRAQGYTMVKQYALGSELRTGMLYWFRDVQDLMDLISGLNNHFGLSNKQISIYSAANQQVIRDLIKGAGLALVGKEITKSPILKVLKKAAKLNLLNEYPSKWIPFADLFSKARIGTSGVSYVGNDHVDDCYRVCRRLLELKETAAGDHATL